MQVPEHFFDAARRRSAMLNRIIVEIANNNLRFGFELARVETVFDVLKLHTEYWQKLLNAFQVKEFGKGRFESGEPRSPVIQDESEKERRDHPQTKARDASGPVIKTSAKQGSEQSPKRGARARAPEVKEKAEVSRPKPKGRRLTSRKAHSGKQRASQDTVSRGHSAKIQFGKLDDNAVRFTSLEAWRLHDGTWRRISVDKVLSDAVVLSKARFNQQFPQVPQLPAGAFLPDRDRE